MLKQILIDADTGIDDSIAILFALKRPDVRVMGVTTGFGNTTARQAAENSLRLIRLAGVPYEVPVAVGATEPLAGNWKGPDPHIHGPNGIGGVELPEGVGISYETAYRQADRALYHAKADGKNRFFIECPDNDD